eukprot:scaffold229258_cov33-Tisochrysis_lutea.AAC.4
MMRLDGWWFWRPSSAFGWWHGPGLTCTCTTWCCACTRPLRRRMPSGRRLAHSSRRGGRERRG